PKDDRKNEVITDLAEIRYCEEHGYLVHEMLTTSDTKEFFTTAINTFLLGERPESDLGWMQFFRIVPLTSGEGMIFPFRDRSKTGEGAHGIVFEDVGEGGEIHFSTVESKEKFVKAIKRATALGYSNEWFEDSMIGLIEMTTEDFRDAHDDKMAAIHYGIITTALSSGVSKSTIVGGSTLDDFITGINSAVAIMKRDKFTPSILLIAPEQEDIAKQALKDVYRDRSVTDSAARLTLIETQHLAAGTAALIQPRSRLVSVDRAALQLGTFDDLLHDSQTLVAKFRRGAAVLDGKCIRGITGL
ncbi:hypothetical protein LCGC14_2362740, partial [marine sediment metagenome]